MKRLLVRVAALGTLIGLGFAVFAHAQRGVEYPAMAAPVAPPQTAVEPAPILPGPSMVPQVAQEAATPGQLRLQPAVTDLAGQPQLFSAAARVNPLRAERQGPSQTIPASAVETQQAPAQPLVAQASATTQTPAASPLDPFSLRAATDTVGTGGPTAPPATPPNNQAPALGVAPPTGAAPPSNLLGDRYGNLGSASPPPAGPAAEMPAPPTSGATLPGTAPAGASASPQPGAPAPPAASQSLPAPPSAAPSAGYPSAAQGDGSSQPFAPSTSSGSEPQGLSLDANQAAPLDGSPAGAGSGKPGEKHLEGPQTPQITIEKLAPPQVQVGKAATFQIKVRNTGQIAAHGVEVRDEVPQGARLLNTKPRASQGVRGDLLWSLGTLNPGNETTIDVELMPVEEGEIGSVATVHFQAQATARAIATKPRLELKSTLAEQVLIGQQVLLSILVTNTGSGTATGVVIEEHVPTGLQHPAGTELEYDVGELKPGESRQLQLSLAATQPGKMTNLLSARGEGDLKVEDRKDLEVVAPRLDLVLEGPERRYLEREAVYLLSVTNPGTAPARQVQLMAQLPPGLQFVSANNAGFYDQASRTVQWKLEELPVRETGKVQLTTMPVEPGEQTLKIRGSDASGLSVEKQQPVKIEGITAINFQVVDLNDPIEMNGQTTYEIKVVNQGSKAATNVQVVALLPPEMRYVAAEGPAQHSDAGGRVTFEPLAKLAPKADAVYRLRVQGVQPGDVRLRVQVTTDEIRTPVTKEESTRVYADN